MNFLELTAVLGLDKKNYDKGLDEASGKASSFASGVGNVVKIVGGAVAAGVGAAAVGVGKLVTSATSAYGEFEQLKGGVEKIFGDSADVIMNYASEAYTTAGLSANNYMQTVTSFSASLIQSLEGDTQAAAEVANRAIIDMSDNANTYGTDMTSIQNAYMGFSKQNYTMLDNLKLGYGGTKEEMARLIEDASKMTEEMEALGVTVDADSMSFANIVNAISVVQEHLKISGTTANEASGTIQGSIGSLRAAWDNLVAGLANPDADIGVLMDNMLAVASNSLQNLIPTVSRALTGVAVLIEQVVPVITAELPGLVGQILPPLLSAATSIVTAVVAALPTILNVLATQLPMVVGQVFPALLQVLPDLLSTIMQILTELVQFLADNASTIIPAVLDVMMVLIATLTSPEVLIPLESAIYQLIDGLIKGLAQASPQIIPIIIELFTNIVQTSASMQPMMLSTAISIAESVFTALLGLIGGFFGSSWNEILDAWNTFTDWCSESFDHLLEDVGNWGADIIENIVTFFSDAWDSVTSGLDDIMEEVGNFGADVIESFFSTFEDAKSVVSDAVDALIDMFDFDWSLPQIKLPHFKVTGGEAPWGFAGQGSFPSVSIQWYKKAMNAPMLLDSATIFGYAGGRALGGGEAGDEMIYGKDALMADIAAVVDARLSALQFTIPVYIGGKKIDQQVVTATARANVISGGR